MRILKSLLILLTLFCLTGLTAREENLSLKKNPQISAYFEAIKESNRYESRDRDTWQKPLEMISLLGTEEKLKSAVIADIGSGTGYFTMRLLPFFGKVIAVDVSDRYLNHIKERTEKHSEKFPEYMKRLELRKAEIHDANLKPGETDFILLSDSYHHIENHTDYFRMLKPALKKGGRILIIDWLEMDRPVGPPKGHGLIPPEIMKRDIEAAGFRVTEIHGVLKYHTVMIAD